MRRGYSVAAKIVIFTTNLAYKFYFANFIFDFSIFCCSRFLLDFAYFISFAQTSHNIWIVFVLLIENWPHIISWFLRLENSCVSILDAIQTISSQIQFDVFIFLNNSQREIVNNRIVAQESHGLTNQRTHVRRNEGKSTLTKCTECKFTRNVFNENRAYSLSIKINHTQRDNVIISCSHLRSYIRNTYGCSFYFPNIWENRSIWIFRKRNTTADAIARKIAKNKCVSLREKLQVHWIGPIQSGICVCETIGFSFSAAGATSSRQTHIHESEELIHHVFGVCERNVPRAHQARCRSFVPLTISDATA